MESDKRKKIKKAERVFSDAGNVLSTIWLRCSFPFNNGPHWVILDSRRYFLWNFRMFLVILYLTIQALKQI